MELDLGQIVSRGNWELVVRSGMEPGFLDLLGVIVMCPCHHLTSNDFHPT